MKKFFTLLVTFLFIGVGATFAQDFSVFETFDLYADGKSMPCIANPMGMPSSTYDVTISVDPLDTENNKALRIIYEPLADADNIKIPVIQVKLGEGETVADITRFEFDFYCYQYPSGYAPDDNIITNFVAANPDYATDIFNNSSSYDFVYYFIPVSGSWYQDTDPYQVDSGMKAVDYHNYSLKNVWIDHCGWDVEVKEASADLNEFYFAFGQNGRQVFWYADNLTFYGVSGAVGTAIGTIEMDKAGNIKGFYNAAGQKLSEAPAQGLYIQDGKKILAK